MENVPRHQVTWRPVAGWPYEVSSVGQVRNTRTGRVLKTRVHASGYEVVQLWQNMAYSTVGVHQLVAGAFLPARPTEKHEVGHRDGNRLHNNHENLKWVTHKENMADRERHGMTARSERNGKTKYTDDQVSEVKQLFRQGHSLDAIAARTGIHATTVLGYVQGSRRAYVA